MIFTSNGVKSANCFDGTNGTSTNIPKGRNGINGHDQYGHAFENGKTSHSENNAKNKNLRYAMSTHEAILTNKQIKEPHLQTLFQLNAGLYHGTKALPLPPFEGMPVPIPGGFCEAGKGLPPVIFDEDVHLNLGNYFPYHEMEI